MLKQKEATLFITMENQMGIGLEGSTFVLYMFMFY